MKKCLPRKKLSLNEQVIAETKGYFAGLLYRGLKKVY